MSEEQKNEALEGLFNMSESLAQVTDVIIGMKNQLMENGWDTENATRIVTEVMIASLRGTPDASS